MELFELERKIAVVETFHERQGITSWIYIPPVRNYKPRALYRSKVKWIMKEGKEVSCVDERRV